METSILFYDVHGIDCPCGKTRQNCALRLKLKKYEVPLYRYDYNKWFSVADSFNGVELDNGALLVVKFFDSSLRGHNNEYDLHHLEVNQCLGCSRENQKDFCKQPHMQTIIYEYTSCWKKCPAGMSVDICPLRKNLADLEEKYEIGYRVLRPDVLLVPCTYHNPKTNIWLGIQERELSVKSGVCWACQDGKIK